MQVGRSVPCSGVQAAPCIPQQPSTPGKISLSQPCGTLLCWALHATSISGKEGAQLNWGHFTSTYWDVKTCQGTSGRIQTGLTTTGVHPGLLPCDGGRNVLSPAFEKGGSF